MSRYFRPEGVLYESVDGLLLLLCLWQVLVVPVFMAIEFAVYLPLAFQAPNLGTSIAVSVGLAADALIALFGALGGIFLWLKRRSGVYLSLIFQGLRITIVVAIGVLSCIGNVVANHMTLGAAIQRVTIPVVIAVAISLAWIAYLLMSRRVKYMYFERHDGAEDWE
jgi:hypothetical protein